MPTDPEDLKKLRFKKVRDQKTKSVSISEQSKSNRLKLE